MESFLTEIDNSKLVKVQGGNGTYEGESEGGCGSKIDDCDITTTYDDQDEETNNVDCNQESNEIDCQTAKDYE